MTTGARVLVSPVGATWSEVHARLVESVELLDRPSRLRLAERVEQLAERHPDEPTRLGLNAGRLQPCDLDAVRAVAVRDFPGPWPRERAIPPETGRPGGREKK